MPLRGGMSRYGDQAREGFSKRFHLGGDEEAVAGLVVDALQTLAFLRAAPDGHAVGKLVARELDLLANVVVLQEADEVTGRKPGIVEHLDGALGGQMTGLLLEPRRFQRIGRLRGRGRVLLAPPREDVRAVKAPDGHAGRLDAVALAKIGARLPAIARAGRRVIEEEEELVDECDGPAVGVLGVPEAVLERDEAGDFWRSGVR